MNIIKNVKSQTKPISIDDYTSSTTVFVRQNIKEIEEIDPVFNTKNTVYVYDEYQYTFPEWNKIITDNIKAEGEVIQEQIDITQLAMGEMLDMIGGIMAFNTLSINEEDDEPKSFSLLSSNMRQFSAIVMMYGAMIKRNLITIDKVLDVYREEVLLYLEILKDEDNKKE